MRGLGLLTDLSLFNGSLQVLDLGGCARLVGDLGAASGLHELATLDLGGCAGVSGDVACLAQLRQLEVPKRRRGGRALKRRMGSEVQKTVCVAPRVGLFATSPPALHGCTCACIR